MRWNPASRKRDLDRFPSGAVPSALADSTPHPAPDRLLAARSALPLAAIAVAMVLPAASDCSKAVTPLEASLESLEVGLAVAPTYLVAALLAFGSLYALRQAVSLPPRAPGTAVMVAVATAIGADVAAALYLGAMAGDHKGTLFSVVAALFALLLVAFLLRARRRQGWARWSTFLAAYLPLSLPVVLLNEPKYTGAKIFFGSYALLVLARGAHVVATRRARQAWPR